MPDEPKEENAVCPEERNDARQLSPVLENYLEIIFHQEIREGAARASSIAEAAGVSRSTVTSTLKALKSMGYVDYEPYSLVHLTEAGMHIGQDIAHRHIVIRWNFSSISSAGAERLNDVACELEHDPAGRHTASGGIRPCTCGAARTTGKTGRRTTKKSGTRYQSNTDKDLVRQRAAMLAMRTR